MDRTELFRKYALVKAVRAAVPGLSFSEAKALVEAITGLDEDPEVSIALVAAGEKRVTALAERAAKTLLCKEGGADAADVVVYARIISYYASLLEVMNEFGLLD